MLRRTCWTRFLSVFLTALALALLVQGIVFLLLRFVPYAKVRTLLDWYVVAKGVSAKAGSDWIEERYNLVIGRMPIVAGVLGICGITLMLFKRRMVDFFCEIPSEWQDFRHQVRDQFPADAKTAVEIVAIAVVFGVGIFLRVWHLKRVVRYDEAWTYLEFASKPLIVGLSNYHAPNNHLLNTLLVHFSTRLFGNTLLGLRFPALASGCLLILAAWLAARSLYGALAGLLTAGSVAALPTFVEFSVNGRGYALQWLSVLALALISTSLLKNPSQKLGWLGFVLAATFGIYSVPTTLIVLAGVFTWMLAATLAQRDAAKLKSRLNKMMLAGLSITALSALLYLPPFLVRGPREIMAETAGWQQAHFSEGVKSLGPCTWALWTEGVPSGILWILLLGLAISLLFWRKVCEKEGPGNPVFLTIALWVTAAVFGWARHVYGMPRVWSYLLLCSVMAACGGLGLFLQTVVSRSRLNQLVLAGAVSIALTVMVAGAVIRKRVLLTTNETGMTIDAEEIADFLTTALHPGNGLVSMSNVVIDYELLQRTPQLYASLGNPTQAAHVVAVVYKPISEAELCRSEELLALLKAQDTADPSVLSNEIDLNAYAPPKVLAKFLTSTVYSFDRREGQDQTIVGSHEREARSLQRD